MSRQQARSRTTHARITIREVAASAGVSVGTVSNVLTGQRQVSSSTRTAVEAAIAELGYVPHVTAQALIGRRGRALPAVAEDAPRLYCVGNVCSDDIAQVDVTPERGTRMKALAITRKLGGRAANVAATAAGLGSPLVTAVELLSVLGNDAESDWAVATLASRRVALARETRFDGRALSRAIILLQQDGLRTILNEPLQVTRDAFCELTERVAEATHRSAIFVQGEQVAALERQIRDAPAGCRFVTQVSGADAASNPDGWRNRFKIFDMVFLNIEAAETLYGTAASREDLFAGVAEGAAARCRIVVLSLGADGAALFLDGRMVARQTAPAVSVLDETGAGDAFAGAFLVAWLHGLDPQTALTLGVAAGARAVACLGAQDHGFRAAELGEIAVMQPPDATSAWAMRNRDEAAVAR